MDSQNQPIKGQHARKRPGQHQIDCYVKWLRLKLSKEYHEVSQEIRRLRECLCEAGEQYRAAHHAYLPYLESNVPDSMEKRIRKQTYWRSQEAATVAQCALTSKQDETCQKFGLCQWWGPRDADVTIQEASDLFSDTPPLVTVLPVVPSKRMRGKVDRLKMTSSTEACLKMQRSIHVDTEGWISLKVNLNAPLEHIERHINRLLRLYRTPPKTRHRPDKDEQALETWGCYEEKKSFAGVARQLGRKVSTVKGQYVRACDLIYAQRPTGSMKQRRAGIVRAPGDEFQAHYASCHRCQNANTADKMCPRFLAFVSQETKAGLDTRASRELSKYGNTGKRTSTKKSD